MISSTQPDFYSSESTKITTGKMQLFLIGACAIGLNTTTRVGPFNLSFADPFLLCVLLLLTISGGLFILRYSIIYFLLLFATAATTSLWITPLIFDVPPLYSHIFGDSVKLIISMLYFILGTSLARKNLHIHALNWFAFGAIFAALIGIASQIIPALQLNPTIYYSNRFRGFMSDPNYYAILACSGVAIFASKLKKMPVKGLTAIIILAASVFLSGSKTGLIILFTLGLILCLSAVDTKKRIYHLTFLAFFSITCLALLNQIQKLLYSLLLKYSNEIPQLTRYQVLLSDNPTAGFSEGGSARASMWNVALQMIQDSPILGVGLGSYLNVSENVFGLRGLAHNTYLQLTAEWGLLFASSFFAWLIYLLIKAYKTNKMHDNYVDLIIIRNITLIFLIGSFSLSLNNARMFWLFLGMLAYFVNQTTHADQMGRLASNDQGDTSYEFI